MQLDNGSIVRLRGANDSTAPDSTAGSGTRAKALGTPAKTSSAAIKTETSTLVKPSVVHAPVASDKKPELKLQAQPVDGTSESFATPGMVGRSGTAMRQPTLDLSAASSVSSKPDVYSPPFEEPTTRALARILMDCHASPRASPSSNTDIVKNEDGGSGCLFLHLQPQLQQEQQQQEQQQQQQQVRQQQQQPAPQEHPPPSLSPGSPLFSSDRYEVPAPNPSLSLAGLDSPMENSSNSGDSDSRSRKSSRLARQLNVQGLGGGSTPRRRQTKESEREAHNQPQHNALLEEASPLAAVIGASGAASTTGKRVVTHDGRSGVVLSSGHGFLAVQIDASHGGGVAKLRANQLSVLLGKRSSSSNSQNAVSKQAAADADQDEDDSDEGDSDDQDSDIERPPALANEELFPDRKYDVRLQYRSESSSESSCDDDDDLDRDDDAELQHEAPDSSRSRHHRGERHRHRRQRRRDADDDGKAATSRTKDGYFLSRTEESGPLGPPSEAQRSAMAAERSKAAAAASSGGYTGAAADLVGKRVRLPDGRTGHVLSSGHGFFAIQLAGSRGGFGKTIKMRGNQLEELEDGDDPVPAASRQRQSSAARDDKPERVTMESSSPRHFAKTPGRKPPAPRNRGPPDVVRQAAATIDAVNPPLPNAKLMIGRAVRLPDGRVGVVIESGHGFFSIEIDDGDFIKLRGNQLSLVVDDPRSSAVAREQQAAVAAAAAGGPGDRSTEKDRSRPGRRASNGATISQPLEEEEAGAGDHNGSKEHRASARESREARLRKRARGSGGDSSDDGSMHRGRSRTGTSGTRVSDSNMEVLPHSGDVEVTCAFADTCGDTDGTGPAAAEFECSLRIARVFRGRGIFTDANAVEGGDVSRDAEQLEKEERTTSETQEEGHPNSDRTSTEWEPMVSIGDLVALVCQIDCRRRAAYIVADLKDKFHQRFQYCRISGYGRLVPMVPGAVEDGEVLGDALRLLTRHSAVSDEQVAGFKASPRYAWIRSVLQQVCDGTMASWRTGSATQETGAASDGSAHQEPSSTDHGREGKANAAGRASTAGDHIDMTSKWFELDWDTVWMQAERAGWSTERGSRRTDLFYIPPQLATSGDASCDNGDAGNLPKRISTKADVRRYLAQYGLPSGPREPAGGSGSKRVDQSAVERFIRQESTTAAAAGTAHDVAESAENIGGGLKTLQQGFETKIAAREESDHMVIQFDSSVSIRVTKHAPLRIALRDIVAIVCRVDMKRAGGRVNKLKLKLEAAGKATPESTEGIVLQHTFGTTSPRRPTAVIEFSQLQLALDALPEECVARFRSSGDEQRLIELMKATEEKLTATTDSEVSTGSTVPGATYDGEDEAAFEQGDMSSGEEETTLQDHEERQSGEQGDCAASPPKRARLAAGDVADAVSTSVRPQQPVHDQHERDDGGATSQLSFGQPANENAEDEPEAEADSGSKRPRLDEVSV